MQEVETSGMGMIENINVDSISVINDSTCFARHSFLNKAINKEVRVLNKYSFNKGLKDLKNKEEVKTEMKSEGEWVEMNF